MRRFFLCLLIAFSPSLHSLKAETTNAHHKALILAIQKNLSEKIGKPVHVKLHQQPSNGWRLLKDLSYAAHTKTFWATISHAPEADKKENPATQRIKGTFLFQKKVPVLTCALKAGEPLTSKNIHWQLMDESRQTLHALDEESKLKNKRAKRPLPSGTILTSSMVLGTDECKKGTPVSVIYQKGSLRIQANGGQLLKKTTVGDYTQVSNPFHKKGKPLWGKLTSPTTVIIENP